MSYTLGAYMGTPICFRVDLHWRRSPKADWLQNEAGINTKYLSETQKEINYIFARVPYPLGSYGHSNLLSGRPPLATIPQSRLCFKAGIKITYLKHPKKNQLKSKHSKNHKNLKKTMLFPADVPYLRVMFGHSNFLSG